MEKTLLDIRDLTVRFRLEQKTIYALRGLSLPVAAGESLAIVGESGSGKSVMVKACMGLLPGNGWIEGGEIWYNGNNLARLTGERSWMAYRGSVMALVTQDPMTALNPVLSVGRQLKETLALHRRLTGAALERAALGLLEDVGLSRGRELLAAYPHQLSGGMRQRVVIAMALACNPRILFCDEPTTALDVTVQARILELLAKLETRLGLTVVYITHDLGVVARCARKVAVMYAGQVVEYGPVGAIFEDARHPYTQALLRSLPRRGGRGRPLYSLPGAPPVLEALPRGDAFAPRNPRPMAIDFVAEPPIFKVSGDHWARTWLLDPRAPKAQARGRLA